jgi:tripartite-type tricarboxylate transporter receptor subunit TctC
MRATRLLSLLLSLALLAGFVTAPVVAQPSAPGATVQPPSEATHIVAGGCGGKWTVHGRDLQPALQSAAP